jgi:rare lipoprotein A
MSLRSLNVALILFLAYGCATGAPQTPRETDVLRGVASWYGEEFAGRTTANGEIFDPMQLTAAHRTLPFGTVIDVTNQKTSQTVRVRINDRGPYIGNRVLDLSFAAAQQIGLIQPGSGEVEMKIVKLGRGEREPPAPYVVKVEEPAEKIPVKAAPEPPAVAFPLPSESNQTFSVEVVEEQRGVPTRRQVSADGRTIEEVPITGDQEVPAAALDRARLRTPPTDVPKVAARGQFVVQAGAFSVESNAVGLQSRLARIGQPSHIDREDSGLYRVRIGPFATREEAVKVRAALEANGMSAIILSE